MKNGHHLKFSENTVSYLNMLHSQYRI